MASLFIVTAIAIFERFRTTLPGKPVPQAVPSADCLLTNEKAAEEWVKAIDRAKKLEEENA